MVNHLGKFSSWISELTQPMRELLSHKRAWLWGPDQEEPFSKVKDQPTTLALYNPSMVLCVGLHFSHISHTAVQLEQFADSFLATRSIQLL